MNPADNKQVSLLEEKKRRKIEKMRFVIEIVNFRSVSILFALLFRESNPRNLSNNRDGYKLLYIKVPLVEFINCVLLDLNYNRLP